MGGLVDDLVDVMSDGVLSTVVAVAGAVVALVCLLVVRRMRRAQIAAPHAEPAPVPHQRRSMRVRSARQAADAPAEPDARAVDLEPASGADGSHGADPVAVPPDVVRSPLLPAPAADGGSAAAFAVAARRDISLLNRQLQTLDELERTETDPDTLQQLFLLDNLTMRLRRGAESLLVLAGSPPGRRVREATPASDVVRTASAQIEFYERVRVDLTDDPPLAAVHVVPVAHLLAEVLENATAFSPPDAVVDVTGACDDEALHLVVRDSGLGMTPEELARAEADLRDRGLVVSRTERLGLAVVGRIADRLGVLVTLSARTDGPGTTVAVRLPRELFDVADPVAPAQPGLGEPVLPEPPAAPVSGPLRALPDAPASCGAGGDPGRAPAEAPYAPVMAHGAHAAAPLSGGPRRTSRSQPRATGAVTAAEGTASVDPAADDGYADLPSFDAILTGGSAVVPRGPAPRHGRGDATEQLTIPAPPPAAPQPAAGTFYPEAAPPPTSGTGPAAPGGTAVIDPVLEDGVSSWAPGGPGGAVGTAGAWTADRSALAERASLQQEALSALSSMSSYRPQVSEATGAAVLTHRRPAAVDAPLDPVEEAVVRDAEALRARLSAFRAGTRLGRETGASLADHPLRTDPTTLAEELP